jgi:redox-sensing transcriptional repressor
MLNVNKDHQVSNSVIRRLPRYYRFLSDLRSNGISKISSQKLSEIMGLTASQIRQDLNCFGGFGQQGYGYNTEALQEEIAKILDFNHQKNIVIIGAGNLGCAIATGMTFENRGFKVVGIFDNDKNVIGKKVSDLSVKSIEELKSFSSANNVSAAVLCIPRYAALSICDLLIECGIKGVWNFSHCDLSAYKNKLTIENVHLGDSLTALGYNLK